MRTPRFIVDAPLAEASVAGERVRLSKSSLHHLRNVLRLQVGDQIEIAWTGCLQPWLCELEEVTPETAIARLIQPAQDSAYFPITLLVGFPKPKIADLLVEKSVELGLQRIAFFHAQHSSQRRLGPEEQKTRLDRFRRVAESALKQSGLSRVPDFILADSLNHALEQVSPHNSEPGGGQSSLKFAFCAPHYEAIAPQENRLGSEAKNAEHFLSVITSLAGGFRASQGTEPPFEKLLQDADSYLVIGPEGGLSDSEVQLLHRSDFRFVSLGPRTLRVETAVIAASSLVALLYSHSPMNKGA